MANSSSDVDAALAGMAKVGAPRVPMGTDAIDSASFPSATDTGKATLVPKGNSKSVDPTAGGKANRSNILSPAVGKGPERNGARYSVSVNTVIPTAPEAGFTQASGRIISPTTNRSRKVFDDGMGTSYS
jgi:hypothetical protein